jgi:hypothetical protein
MRKENWEMMSQITEGGFELTLYWNTSIHLVERRYKVEEKVTRRNVITESRKFLKLETAERYFKHLVTEANNYKNSRFHREETK